MTMHGGNISTYKSHLWQGRQQVYEVMQVSSVYNNLGFITPESEKDETVESWNTGDHVKIGGEESTIWLPG